MVIDIPTPSLRHWRVWLPSVLFCVIASGMVSASSDIQPMKGELCVEGRLVGPVDSNANSFSILANIVRTPDQAEYWLAAMTPKTVRISRLTQYSFGGQPVDSASYRDDGHAFYHILAVGFDHGKGMPLDARSVSITMESDSQRFIVDHYCARHTGLTNSSGAPRPQIDEESTVINVNGHAFDVIVVSAKLNTVAVRCAIAQGRVGATDSLGSIAQRYGAVAAINGSFFDSYDSGPIKKPDMPLISHGKLMNYSNIGTVLGFTSDGQWRMDSAQDVVRMCGENRRRVQSGDDESFQFWSQVTEAVGCGPRLVVNGAVKMSPYDEGFSSDHVLKTHAARSAVGITRDDRILLVATRRASLEDMAQIMINLGCVQAMNLDGGASSGVWYRGRTVVQPGRQLSNALVISAR